MPDVAPLFLADGRPGPLARAAVAALARADPTLARLIRRVGPFRLTLRGFRSPFEALAQAIVYQQLSGKAAATIFERLCGLFPEAQGFPAPAQVLDTPEERLRSAGLSRAKALAILDLAARSVDGTVPTAARVRRMSDEELVERLTVVRGVGRWTVEMLLMFRLGRPDVLPLADYGIRKGFTRAFGLSDLADAEAVAKRGERWRPYRTVASWYLWRALELP